MYFVFFEDLFLFNLYEVYQLYTKTNQLYILPFKTSFKIYLYGRLVLVKLKRLSDFKGVTI